jgi:hypothetical protein
MWGSKPYDRNIKPVDTVVVSVLAFGEGKIKFDFKIKIELIDSFIGFHNYHVSCLNNLSKDCKFNQNLNLARFSMGLQNIRIWILLV